MAERRMFAKTIIDSDAFLELPLTAQAVYFHLAMRADDDGFINSPKKIQRMVGGSDGDLQELIGKRFILSFPSGVVVIKHWKIHNYIQKDRYIPTVYNEEKSRLRIKENKAYSLMDTECIQTVSKMDTQVRLGKVSIDKNNTPSISPPGGANTAEEEKKAYGEEFSLVRLSEREYGKLAERMGKSSAADYIDRLDRWLAEGHRKKNHYATLLNWYRKDHPEKGRTGAYKKTENIFMDEE